MLNVDDMSTERIDWVISSCRLLAAIGEEFERTRPFSGMTIGTGIHPFSWAGVDYISHSTFFAIPMAGDVEVHFGGLEEGEVGNIFRAGWWTAEDLAADGSAASPDLPDMMRAAVAAVHTERPRS